MSGLREYTIKDVIYEAPQSTVYHAICEKDQSPVLIKLLNNECPSQMELAQFTHEYGVLKQLQQAGVAGVPQPLTIEKEANTSLLVFVDAMPEGISFERYLDQGCLGVTEFLPVAIQITDILEQVHQANFIHKDIKPASFLFNEITIIN